MISQEATSSVISLCITDDLIHKVMYHLLIFIHISETQEMISYSFLISTWIEGLWQKRPNWHFAFFCHLCSKVAAFLHVTQYYQESKCSIIFLAGLFFISKNWHKQWCWVTGKKAITFEHKLKNKNKMWVRTFLAAATSCPIQVKKYDCFFFPSNTHNRRSLLLEQLFERPARLTANLVLIIIQL